MIAFFGPFLLLPFSACQQERFLDKYFTRGFSLDIFHLLLVPRLEAIGSRLEAIALRLERPSLLGWRPFLVGSTPH